MRCKRANEKSRNAVCRKRQSVDAPCFFAGFRKLVLDPLESTISGCLYWMIEDVGKRRDNGQTSDGWTPGAESGIS